MVIGREALLTIPPGMIVWARLLGGGGSFLLIARACGDRDKLDRADLPRLIACGVLGTASNQLFLIYGLARTTAVNASVLSTTVPVITLLVALVLRLESPRLYRMIGVVLALLGAMALVGVGRFSVDDQYAAGNLLILGNCASWALFFVVSRPLVTKYRPMGLAARLFAVGFVASAPLCARPALAFLPTMTATDAAYLGFLIAVPTVGTYALNQIAMRRAEPSVVASSWYLLPIFGTAGAMIRLGERPHSEALVAAGLILVGLYFASRDARSGAVVVDVLVDEHEARLP
jgi:drug/metabolite transporter (DMT)-like permease